MVLLYLPTPHLFAFLLFSFSLTPLLLIEKLELAAWIHANVEGLATLMAVPVNKVLPPTEPRSS